MTLPKVVVAMSGGVDSSVAAALLVEQGYSVTGMMLRLWSEPGSEDSNRCCTPDAMMMARRVAARLGIPFYAVDVQETFREQVVQGFLDGYARGETPNPCILCNRQIRWGVMMDRALALGATYMATGHYARLQRDESGLVSLLKGRDAQKDQSYVLSALTQKQLAATLLPVGDYEKARIRDKARQLGLSVANRPDSQDLCFLAGGDYRVFLSRYVPEVVQPGAIVNRAGEVLGQHQGLAFYTVGQRKGILIPAAQPYYVLDKDVQNNRLVIGPADELGRSRLEAMDANWVRGNPPPQPFEASIKIRYRAREVTGQVTPQGLDRFSVDFAEPLRDITAGQRVVLYQGDICLGGGTIRESWGG